MDDSLATTQASQPGLARRPPRRLKRKCMLSEFGVRKRGQDNRKGGKDADGLA
jgi:hypothetical protein